MFENEPVLARDLARRASQELLAETRDHGMPFHGEFIYSWRPLETLQILLDLGLHDEALSLSKSMIEARPVDLDLLHMNARILEQSGLWSQALEMQRMVVALDPIQSYLA